MRDTMEESHGEIVEEEIRAVSNDRSQVVNSQQVVDNVEYKSTLNRADDDEVGATQLPPNAAIHPSTTDLRTSNIDHGATTDTPMVQTGSLNSFVAAGINKVEHRDERIKGRAKCNVTRPGVAEFVAISARHTTTERKSAKGTTITSRSSTPSGKASHVDRMKAPAVDPGNNSPQQREIIVALDEEVCVNDNSPIVAIAVDGDDEKEKVYAVAVRFDPGSDSSVQHHRHFRIYRIVGATIFLISLAIAIYFAVADRDDDPPDFTLPITVRPTFSPTSGREKVYMDLFAEFVGDKVFTLDTPHSSAAKWIISEDPLKLKRNNPKLLQRYLLAFLYFHTTGNTVTRWKSCNPPARNQSDTCRNIGNKDVRPNTTISRWLSGQDECTWAGVQCYQRYFVENIFLADQKMTGTLPTELVSLTLLRSIDFQDNQMTGTFPPEYANMGLLQHLQLDRNNLYGTIPEELFSLSNLATLSMSDMELTGTLSTLVGQLTKLRTLDLSNNRLTGTIPSEVKLIPAFGERKVSLHGNQFT